MKVLIVDDEKLIRDVIKEYCLGNKYEVIEADNGLDAIKLASEADIIVMDIMMPKMDGFTAYKADDASETDDKDAETTEETDDTETNAETETTEEAK